MNTEFEGFKNVSAGKQIKGRNTLKQNRQQFCNRLLQNYPKREAWVVGVR